MVQGGHFVTRTHMAFTTHRGVYAYALFAFQANNKHTPPNILILFIYTLHLMVLFVELPCCFTEYSKSWQTLWFTKTSIKNLFIMFEMIKILMSAPFSAKVLNKIWFETALKAQILGDSLWMNDVELSAHNQHWRKFLKLLINKISWFEFCHKKKGISDEVLPALLQNWKSTL